MLKPVPSLTGNERYEGFCIDLLKEIANMVGFEYRIELVPDGKYGVYDLETGEWNGIVRQLMDKVRTTYSGSRICKICFDRQISVRKALSCKTIRQAVSGIQ